MKSDINHATKKERNVLDRFLYVLAGSVFLIMGFSFLLWLRF